MKCIQATYLCTYVRMYSSYSCTYVCMYIHLAVNLFYRSSSKSYVKIVLRTMRNATLYFWVILLIKCYVPVAQTQPFI